MSWLPQRVAAGVATGCGAFVPSFRERGLPYVTETFPYQSVTLDVRRDRRIGIPSKAPQLLHPIQRPEQASTPVVGNLWLASHSWLFGIIHVAREVSHPLPTIDETVKTHQQRSALCRKSSQLQCPCCTAY